MLAGIWPAACIALYCNGVMCSNPGGGTSQYKEILRLRDRLFLFGERERLLLRFSRERDLLARPRDDERSWDL